MGEKESPQRGITLSLRHCPPGSLQLQRTPQVIHQTRRMDPDTAPGPPKRRRTSSLGTSYAPPPSPHRRSSGASAGAEGSPKAKGKQVDRNPLAGFDDREEEVEEVAAGVVEEPVNEDEHCAICLSPIVNMVRSWSLKELQVS